jgi:hypothetical protein
MASPGPKLPEYFVYVVHSALQDEKPVLDLDDAGNPTLTQVTHPPYKKSQQWRVYRLTGRIQNVAMAENDRFSGYLTRATSIGPGALSITNEGSRESQEWNFEPGPYRQKPGPPWQKQYTVTGRPMDPLNNGTLPPMAFVITVNAESKVVLDQVGDPVPGNQSWYFDPHPGPS